MSKEIEVLRESFFESIHNHGLEYITKDTDAYERTINKAIDKAVEIISKEKDEEIARKDKILKTYGYDVPEILLANGKGLYHPDENTYLTICNLRDIIKQKEKEIDDLRAESKEVISVDEIVLLIRNWTNTKEDSIISIYDLSKAIHKLIEKE